MVYKTIFTSEGTITITTEICKQLGLKPGAYISFEKNKITGEYTLKRSRTIQEIRAMNKEALKQLGTAHKGYKSGDGFAAYPQQSA